MPSPEEELRHLQAQKLRVDTQIQRVVNRKRKQERQQGTRRKIVVGAVVLKAAIHDKKFALQLRHLLEQHITTERDRVLLGLPTVKPETTPDENLENARLKAA